MAQPLGKVFRRPVKKDGPYWIDLDTEKDRANFMLAAEWKERAAAMRKMAPYIAAWETLGGLLEHIPGGPAWNEYRNALKVVRVGPRSWAAGVHAVYGKPKAKKRDIETDLSVLYVRPKKNRMTPPHPSVAVLAKYSPWTTSTLPFSPKPNEAVIVVRKVSKREVGEVAGARENDRPKWQEELNRAGVRNSRKPKSDTDPSAAKMVSDLAFSAMRLEFGYGGTKAVPHWKPAVKQAARHVRRLFTRKSPLTQPMLQPKNRRWQKWPPKVDSSIRIAELKTLKKFQKRLRIRV